MEFSFNFNSNITMVFDQNCLNWVGVSCSKGPTYINNTFNSFNKFNGGLVGYEIGTFN